MNIGMGARIPEMQNPLRSRAEKIPAAGFRFLDTTKNRIRFRAWWGYLLHDQWIFFFALNLVTMLLFIFGALSVLHPIGKVPAEGQLIWDEAQVLAEAWEPVGRTVFLLVGLATLFSTQLAILDGVSRSMPISCTRIFEQHAHVT